VSGEEAVGALCVAEVFGESWEGFEGAGSEPRGEGVLHPPCYLLMEAEHALRIVGDPRPSLRFDNEDYGKNLGRFITYFDDDPKSRLGMRLRIRRRFEESAKEAGGDSNYWWKGGWGCGGRQRQREGERGGG